MGLKINYIDAKTYRELLKNNEIKNNELYFIVNNYSLKKRDLSHLVERDYFLKLMSPPK